MGSSAEVKRIVKRLDSQETVLVVTTPDFWSQRPNKILRSQDGGANFQEVRDLGTYRGDLWTPRDAVGSSLPARG